MKSFRLIGLALAAAAILAFPAHASVADVGHDQVVSASTDNCTSPIAGALVSEFAIVEHDCNAVLAEATGLCLVPAEARPSPSHRLVMLIPAALDATCAATRPSPPG